MRFSIKAGDEELEPEEVHCWEHAEINIDGEGILAVCMLRDGHDGMHSFYPASEVLISFL